jgi:hypothetical protein
MVERDYILLGGLTLLLHGQIIKNIFVIIDYAKGALRGGTLFNSPNWSPDSVKTESFGFGIGYCLQENWSTTLGLHRASGYLASYCFGISHPRKRY